MKSLELIVDNGLIYAEYSLDQKTIFMRAEGIPVHEKVVNGWNKIIEFSKGTEVETIFVNSMQMRGTFSNSNEYFKNVAIPFFNDTSLKYLTIAMSLDVFSRFAFNQLSKMGSHLFKMIVFKNTKTAHDYLEEKYETKILIPDKYLDQD